MAMREPLLGPTASLLGPASLLARALLPPPPSAPAPAAAPPPRSPRAAAPQSLDLSSRPFFARAPHERLPALREFIALASARSDLEGRTEAALVNVLDASRAYLQGAAAAAGAAAADGEEAGLSSALAQRLGGAAAAPAALLATAEALRASARHHARHAVMERALEDALRRLEGEPAGAAAAFPHRDFSAGLQLLPETALQYRLAGAEWLIAFDALTFGVLGAALLKTVRHSRIFLSPEAQGGTSYTVFRSVLAPCASFDKSFDSRAYDKALSLRWVLWFGVACSALLACDAVIVTINLLELTPPNKNPFLFLNYFIFSIIDDIKRSILDGAPSTLPFAVGSFALMFLLCLSYVVLVALRSDVAAFVKAQEKDLPSSLALVLRTPAPMLMLSYTWKAPYVDVARSLAAAVPNTWVDVQTLASGVEIPAVTAAVSRWAYAQVVFMSADYLQSPACLLELFTALLRRQAYQHLLVYHDKRFAGEVEGACLTLLEDMGCIVVHSPEDLLVQLDTRIYSCSSAAHGPMDAKRALSWWSHVGVPLEAVPRAMLLPSPRAKRQRWLCNCCAPQRSGSGSEDASTLLPPAGAIVSGFRYITGDGLRLGSSCFLGLEFFYAAASLAAFVLGIVFIATAVRQMAARGATLYWGTQYAVPPMLIALALVWLFNGLSLSVLTDMRAYHSGLLLPLNVAASLNSLGAASLSDDAQTKYSVLFLVSPASNAELSAEAMGRRSEHEWTQLDASVRNMVRFLNEDVGLEASVQLWRPEAEDSGGGVGDSGGSGSSGGGGGGDPWAASAAAAGDPWTASSASSIRLVVFVLRSRAAVRSYLRHWKRRVSPDCSVLVGDFRCCEGTALTQSMVISLGPTNGLSAFSPYKQQGLVAAILDSLGAKVGAAFVEHARDSQAS